MDLKYTRAMVKAALNGELRNAEYEEHEIFKVLVPQSIKDVPSEILNPKNTWSDGNKYDEKAIELANKFNENFKKFKEVSEDIASAGPKAKVLSYN